MIITFHEDGSATTLATDALPLASIGQTTKRRVSHIWPCHPVKRIAFRVLRSLFGERGAVPTWCRSWRGPWEVRFARNIHRVVFSHPSRRVCLAWEINQLDGNV